MNENQIVTNKNENTHMAANIFKDSFSKLNGKEVLIGLGIISATFLGTTGIVCFAGGKLSIGNGTFKISRLEKSTA